MAKRRTGNNTGRSKDPAYAVWRNMYERCYWPKHHAWENYGGRGITMSDEWKNSFETFIKDMGPRPSKEFTVDRVDNNGGYCKENCRWATRKSQILNRRPYEKWVLVEQTNDTMVYKRVK